MAARDIWNMSSGIGAEESDNDNGWINVQTISGDGFKYIC